MKMILIDSEKSSSELIDTEESFENYCKTLNCEMIDYSFIRISGQYYTVIRDYEALAKEETRVSVIDEDGDPFVFGSILICRDNEDGGESGLSDDDIEIISSRISTITSPGGEKNTVVIADD